MPEGEPGIQIAADYLKDLKEQSQKEKEVLDEAFKGKSLQEIVQILSDTDSEVVKIIHAKPEVASYIAVIEQIAQEIKLKGFFSNLVIAELQKLPKDNELRYMVEEAAAREILQTIDFGTFKTIDSIQQVLQQLKRFLHAEDYMKDSSDTFIKINDYVDVLEGIKILRADSKHIPRGLINAFTTRYGLRAAVEHAVGVDSIDESS